MRGITPIISIIVLLFICAAVVGFAWLFISGYFGYTKLITIPPGSSSCTFHSSNIIIQNAGTEIIKLVNASKGFSKIGNMIPNSGFELDTDGDNKPDFWEGGHGLRTIDAVLITDLSNSMSDCMDSIKKPEDDKDAVLVLHFDDGTAHDSSEWGNDCIISGGLTYRPDGGRFGGAFDFNGIDSYIDCGNDSSLYFSGQRTIMFWVKTTSSDTAIIGQKGGRGQWLLMIESDNKLKYHSWMDSGCMDLAGNTIVNDGEWKHIAVTIDVFTGNITSYVNGNYDTKDWSPYIYPATENLYIGSCNKTAGAGWCSHYSPNFYFNGRIDEVYIFNRTLSLEEIRSYAGLLRKENCPNESTYRPDKPQWCRYEPVCPEPCYTDDEQYCSRISPTTYRNVSYQKLYVITSDENCFDDMGHWDGICPDTEKQYLKRYSPQYIEVLTNSIEECLNRPGINLSNTPIYAGCSDPFDRNKSNEGCTTEPYNCSGIQGKPYTVPVYKYTWRDNPPECRESEFELTNYRKYACGEFNREISDAVCNIADNECGTSPRPGDRCIKSRASDTWRDCNGTDCSSPTICNLTEFNMRDEAGGTRPMLKCMESCDVTGWKPGSGCTPSCGGLTPYCCESDEGNLQVKCRQCIDTCCKLEKVLCKQCQDKCCDRYGYECRIGQKCCWKTEVCERACIDDNCPLIDSCEPGFHGGIPVPENNCNGGVWSCNISGGCYVCNSVAIRLAKKLDRNFVHEVFDHARQTYMPDSVKVGLVSYSTNVISWHQLVDYSQDANLANIIDNYKAEQGETCIACAIEKAIEILQDSTADKRYIILMSDGEANVGDDYSDEHLHSTRGQDWNNDGVKGDAKDDAVARACVYNNEHPDKQIIFYTIGFGKDAGADTLKAIADCSGDAGRYFQGNNPQELEEIYREISQRISNAGRINMSKYGGYSMWLKSYDNPPVALSEEFNVYPELGENYTLWFYRKLNLTENEVFNITVYFYDMSGKITGMFWNETAGPVNDADFYWEQIDIDIPAGSEKAAIEFEFNSSVKSGEVIIDDIYFGPIVGCTKEGGIWKCGDMIIEKLSQDGEMYPYFDNSSLNPQNAVVLRDANCHGTCKYSISTTTNMVDVEVECQG